LQERASQQDVSLAEFFLLLVNMDEQFEQAKKLFASFENSIAMLESEGVDSNCPLLLQIKNKRNEFLFQIINSLSKKDIDQLKDLRSKRGGSQQLVNEQTHQGYLSPIAVRSPQNIQEERKEPEFSKKRFASTVFGKNNSPESYEQQNLKKIAKRTFVSLKTSEEINEREIMDKLQYYKKSIAMLESEDMNGDNEQLIQFKALRDQLILQLTELHEKRSIAKLDKKRSIAESLLRMEVVDEKFKEAKNQFHKYEHSIAGFEYEGKKINKKSILACKKLKAQLLLKVFNQLSKKEILQMRNSDFKLWESNPQAGENYLELIQPFSKLNVGKSLQNRVTPPSQQRPPTIQFRSLSAPHFQ